MARFTIFLFVLLSLVISVASASSAPVFCKCTCNKNSTIIALEPETSTSSTLLFQTRDDLVPRAATSLCAQCTKAFCLSQGLDICKDAAEEDVVTLCFKRDSIKDRIIVWGFIVGTVGLLGWALFKRVKQRREERREAAYAPMSGGR